MRQPGVARSVGAPRSVGAAAQAVVAARGRRERLARVFDRSPVPLLMVDDERRYVEANRPARYAFRLTRDEMRRRRIEDLIRGFHAAGAGYPSYSTLRR